MMKSLFAAAVGFVAITPGPATIGTAPKDPLLGLWASETTFGPKMRGELSVTRGSKGWRAMIAGITVPFEVAGDSVRFALPDRAGEFRGALVGEGGAHGISSFWIQPPGVVLTQPYASPLLLRPKGRNSWHASVVPLDDRFSLYLSVAYGKDSSLVGAFRNPDRNSPGAALRFRIAQEGDSVRLSARREDQPELHLTAAFDTRRRRLTMWWPDIGRSLVLTPRTERQATGLYPRLPRGQVYRYRAPSGAPAVDDGWVTAPASEVGIDERMLEQLVQSIADTEPTAPRAPLIHSVLVARHGRLVLEEYFLGFNRNQPYDTRSAAKTFASVLVGTAMRVGIPIAPETGVYGLLAPRGPFSNPDPRKQRITVGNLMTHTSGLACDDNENASPGNENTMQAQQDQPDWWKYTLDLPMTFDPGTHYAYCSGGMNLTGATLTEATGRWLPDFFDRTVAQPLKFGRYYFNLIPTNQGYLGGGVYLRPRDLIKVGQAYLDGGSWKGTRLVDSAWVTRSTAHQVDTPFGADGFAWHLYELHQGDRTYREYEANGNGGQLLIVLPELDAVVVFTAGNYMHGGVWSKFRDELVPRFVIAAIKDR